MFKNLCIPPFCLSLCLLSSIALFSQGTQVRPSDPQLVFESGFEGNSKVIAVPGSDDYGAPLERIVGKDTKLKAKNDWDKDWQPLLGTGFMQVQYTGGEPSKRYAQVVPEPGNPDNHVLHFWLGDAWLASEGQIKSRIQTNLYGIKEGLKEFYQSVRVFLPEDFNALRNYPGRLPWCTLSEFWNNEWWVKGEPYGFRITLGVGKPTAETSDLNFILNAEGGGKTKEVWNGDNVDIKVPIGKWFTMDYYYKEGNAETGRFWMAITPDGEAKQVVFDIHNFTHNPKDPAPNGVTGYNPFKLYTSKDYVAHVKAQGKTLQVYWDDFKLWTNKKPAEKP